MASGTTVACKYETNEANMRKAEHQPLAKIGSGRFEIIEDRSARSKFKTAHYPKIQELLTTASIEEGRRTHITDLLA